MLTKNKIEKPFTEDEINQLRYMFSRVAHKYSCSPSTVQKIANGKRGTNTELAKSVIKTLKQVLHVLKPIEK